MPTIMIIAGPCPACRRKGAIMRSRPDCSCASVAWGLAARSFLGLGSHAALRRLATALTGRSHDVRLLLRRLDGSGTRPANLRDRALRRYTELDKEATGNGSSSPQSAPAMQNDGAAGAETRPKNRPSIGPSGLEHVVRDAGAHNW